jgi:hypothetical protein
MSRVERPLACQLEDLQLAVAQHLEGGLHDALAPAFGHALQQPFVDLLAHENAAVEHLPDGPGDVVAGLLLHHVAARAGPDAALGVEGLVVS